MAQWESRRGTRKRGTLKDRKSKGTRRAAKRRRRKALAADELRRQAQARAHRSDTERRDRMRELDDATPMKPAVSDLIVGKDAERELARIERAREAQS